MQNSAVHHTEYYKSCTTNEDKCTEAFYVYVMDTLHVRKGSQLLPIMSIDKSHLRDME